MDKEEGRRRVRGGFYSRAGTRALTHIGEYSGFSVNCGSFGWVLISLVWLAEKAGTHEMFALIFWNSGTIPMRFSPGSFLEKEEEDGGCRKSTCATTGGFYMLRRRERRSHNTCRGSLLVEAGSSRWLDGKDKT